MTETAPHNRQVIIHPGPVGSLLFLSQLIISLVYIICYWSSAVSATCAAARRAKGIRIGEQLT